MRDETVSLEHHLYCKLLVVCNDPEESCKRGVHVLQLPSEYNQGVNDSV